MKFDFFKSLVKLAENGTEFFSGNKAAAEKILSADKDNFKDISEEMAKLIYDETLKLLHEASSGERIRCEILNLLVNHKSTLKAKSTFV